MPTPRVIEPLPAIRKRRKAARPQELLDAALELFVERGFASTRCDDVAQRAGVSKGTLFLYYPSKEELLKEVVRQNLTQLIAEGAQPVDEFAGSTSDLLRRLLRGWWNRVGNTPAAGIFKVMMAEVRNFPELARFYGDEVIAPAEALLSRTLQRGVDRREFRAVPVHETTVLLFAPMMFMSLHKHTVGACTVKDVHTDMSKLIDTHIDVVLHGLERAHNDGNGSARRPVVATARSKRISRKSK